MTIAVRVPLAIRRRPGRKSKRRPNPASPRRPVSLDVEGMTTDMDTPAGQ
jgi:hypothetical protein